MGHKQYGKRGGGDGEIYQQACGTRVRRKKSGKVHPANSGAMSTYVPVTFEKTNAYLCKQDTAFKGDCTKVGIDPTVRQYSKWKNGRGRARLGV